MSVPLIDSSFNFLTGNFGPARETLWMELACVCILENHLQHAMVRLGNIQCVTDFPTNEGVVKIADKV